MRYNMSIRLDITGPYSSMSDLLPYTDTLSRLYESGYQRREAQEVMMSSVNQALENDSVLVLEGGTGIGKSFGYLIPALLNKQQGQKVVVSTATIALQEQIFYKELPELERITGLTFSYHLAKGRKRYVCPMRLNEMISLEESMEGMWEESSSSDSDDDTLEDMQEALQNNEWDGDRDTWQTTILDRAWNSITTDRHGCLGNKCSHYQGCPFFTAKKKMYRSDIIIGNHSLLLSDIAVGSGKLLPEIEDTIYIIDEAHKFPAKAVDTLGASATVKGAITWLKSLQKAVSKIPHTAQISQALRVSEDIAGSLESAYEIIALNYSENLGDEGYWMVWECPGALVSIGSDIARQAEALAELLSGIIEHFKDKMESSDQSITGAITALSFLQSRAENLEQTWVNFLTQFQIGTAPVAKWIEAHTNSDKDDDFLIHTAPTSAANDLLDGFWKKRENAVIMCSATLRSLGKFDRFLRQSGLNLVPHNEVITSVLESPFRYNESVLWVPKMQHSPAGKESAAHTQEISSMLPKIIDQDGGTLVVFTSKSIMREVFEQLPDEIAEHILMQGEKPKQVLISEHRRKVKTNGWSVLFGLDSFAEGLDLPGNDCKHVIVAKLKFPVPTTPVEKVKADYIKRINKNSFMEFSLPEASVYLIQVVGRLLRKLDDVGMVTILDRRIVDKQYGKLLLKNLPAFQVHIER